MTSDERAEAYGKLKPAGPRIPVVGETAGFKANLSRYDIEKAENCRKIAVDIPFIPLPKGWLIKPMPPWGGAIVRFVVKLPDGQEKSVYLDCFDRIGCVGEPYWEVHPVDGDCGRCMLNEVHHLIKLIKRKG